MLLLDQASRSGRCCLDVTPFLWRALSWRGSIPKIGQLIATIGEQLDRNGELSDFQVSWFPFVNFFIFLVKVYSAQIAYNILNQELRMVGAWALNSSSGCVAPSCNARRGSASDLGPLGAVGCWFSMAIPWQINGTCWVKWVKLQRPIFVSQKTLRPFVLMTISWNWSWKNQEPSFSHCSQGKPTW